MLPGEDGEGIDGGCGIPLDDGDGNTLGLGIVLGLGIEGNPGIPLPVGEGSAPGRDDGDPVWPGIGGKLDCEGVLGDPPGMGKLVGGGGKTSGVGVGGRGCELGVIPTHALSTKTPTVTPSTSLVTRTI